MPIISETTPTEAPDKIVSRDIAGNRCDYAVVDNIPPGMTADEIERCNEQIRRDNKDRPPREQQEEYRTIQQDRAAVVEMPGIFSNKFSELMNNVFDEMRHRNREVIDRFKPIKNKKEFNGDSTGTIVFYDPKNYKLKVGSKGDSPAYVLVQSGDKSRLIKISSENTHVPIAHPDYPGKTVQMLNNLASRDVYKPGYPMFDGQGKITTVNKHPESLINLKQVISDACKDWGVPVTDEVKLSIIVTSDGVIDRAYGSRQNFADVFAEAEKKIPPVNLSETLINYTKSQHGRDNCSTIILRDVKQNPQGTSVALCICDGHETDGHLMADAGIKAFQRYIEMAAQPSPRPVKDNVVDLHKDQGRDGAQLNG